jgi:thioredoxin reductase
MSMFDVVVIGGSTSGIASALALARVMVKTLVVDSGRPCNRFAPEAHNFLGYDGVSPRFDYLQCAVSA